MYDEYIEEREELWKTSKMDNAWLKSYFISMPVRQN